MKTNRINYRRLYYILHQGFSVAMVTSMYIYDYIILHGQTKNSWAHLLISALLVIGAITTFALYCQQMLQARGKKAGYQKEGFLDTIYIEIILLIAALLVLFLVSLLRQIDIIDFSIAGLSATVGTVSYLIDTILLYVVAEMAGRIRQKRLSRTSLIVSIYRFIQNYEKDEGIPQLIRRSKERANILAALQQMAEKKEDVRLDLTEYHGQEYEMAKALNHIQEGLTDAVEEKIRNERMKAELITNVSHDIKTPLTSIINYTELLLREDLANERAKLYVDIIDEKAKRLKVLTENLVEISKLNSGNVKLDIQRIDFLELLYQTGGEFNERFEKRNLTIITKLPEVPVYIDADGAYLYRTLENLYVNAAKYAKENSKVYVELYVEKRQAVFSIRNISQTHIDIAQSAYTDLTERFVRGERSRTTEGSGLGLSIAKNIVEFMNGKFRIRVEGELFIAEMCFMTAKER